MELASVLIVDGLHGVNTVKVLVESVKRLYSVESPRGNPLPYTPCEHVEEIISDGDLYVRHNAGVYWRLEWNDGDIIAVNPEALWCEKCERYEIPLDESTTVYDVAEHWLPSIINGDITALSDAEEIELEKWLLEHGGAEGHWSVNPEHSQELSTCNISGLISRTVELHRVAMS